MFFFFTLLLKNATHPLSLQLVIILLLMKGLVEGCLLIDQCGDCWRLKWLLWFLKIIQQWSLPHPQPPPLAVSSGSLRCPSTDSRTDLQCSIVCLVILNIMDPSSLYVYIDVHDARNCLEDRFEINMDWIRETSYETLNISPNEKSLKNWAHNFR